MTITISTAHLRLPLTPLAEGPEEKLKLLLHELLSELRRADCNSYRTELCLVETDEPFQNYLVELLPQDFGSPRFVDESLLNDSVP